MFAQGVIVDPSSAGSTDGSTVTANAGRANELLVAELHGKYLEQCYRGNVFYGSTATAGVVIAISSTLTPTFSLWNPAGSGKLCVPIVTLLTWTATTSVLGGLVWHSTANAGSGIATAAAFSAFGTGTPVNAHLGHAKASAMRFAGGGTTTLTAAATFYRSLGVTILSLTVASVVTPFIMREDWDGAGAIAPGNAIHLFGSTAVALTATVSLGWAEIPI